VPGQLPDDVIARHSRKFAVLGRVKQVIMAKWAALGTYLTVDNTLFAVEMALGIGAIGLAVWLLVRYLEKQSLRDAAEGRWVPSGLAQAAPAGSLRGDGHDEVV
jgi:hypothetical protein